MGLYPRCKTHNNRSAAWSIEELALICEAVFASSWLPPRTRPGATFADRLHHAARGDHIDEAMIALRLALQVECRACREEEITNGGTTDHKRTTCQFGYVIDASPGARTMSSEDDPTAKELAE